MVVKRLMIAIGVCLVCLSPAWATVYDLTADVAANGGWSATSPTVGTWTAGSSQALGTFTAYDTYLGSVPPDYLTIWHSPAYLSQGFNADNATSGHVTPHTYFSYGKVLQVAENTWDGSNYTVYSIIRWTAPEAGPATVNVTIGNIAPTKVDAWVLKNGVTLFSQGATEPETDIVTGILNTSVAVGDTIDLVIKRTAGQDGAHAGNTFMDAQINVVPEPISLAMLASGGLFLGLRRKP